jgi:hypothetical protein
MAAAALAYVPAEGDLQGAALAAAFAQMTARPHHQQSTALHQLLWILLLGML